jgi:micrococcal nuclease
MKMTLSLACSFLMFATATAAPPRPLVGKVVGVADGDTVTVLAGQTPYKVRLNGIDAPERGQAFSQKAKQALADKVFGKSVKVEWKKLDRYQRILGEIYLGARWINHEMVVVGLAWRYKHSTDAELGRAEAAARAARRGLWIDPEPAPPWDYRTWKTP